jgi:hypothetical protein
MPDLEGVVENRRVLQFLFAARLMILVRTSSRIGKDSDSGNEDGRNLVHRAGKKRKRYRDTPAVLTQLTDPDLGQRGLTTLVHRRVLHRPLLPEKGGKKSRSGDQELSVKRMGQFSFTPIGVPLKLPSSPKHVILPAKDYQTDFYENYRKVAEEYDKEFLKKYDEDLNTTLIFVNLACEVFLYPSDLRFRLVFFLLSPPRLLSRSTPNSDPTRATRLLPSFVSSFIRLTTPPLETTFLPSHNGSAHPARWFTSK